MVRAGEGGSIPDIGKDVSLPHRTATKSEDHTASCTVGNRNNFLRVNWLEREALQSAQSQVKVKNVRKSASVTP